MTSREQAIERCAKEKHVVLKDVRVDSSLVDELLAALRGNEHIESLTLINCSFVDESSWQRLSEGLASRPMLVRVTLWNTRVDARLLAQCAGLQALGWSGEGGVPDRVIKLLERLPSLRELTIGGCEMELSHVQRLGRALQCSAVAALMINLILSVEAKEAIGQLVTSTLKKLSLPSLGVRGCESLLQGLQRRMPLVEVLELNNVGMQQEQAVALASWMRQIKCLRSLDLRGNSMGDAGAGAICEALLLQDGLEELRLCGVCMSGYPDALLQLVWRSKTLRVLYLSDWVSSEEQERLLDALVANTSLRELRLFDVDESFAEQLFARKGWMIASIINHQKQQQHANRNRAAHAMVRAARWMRLSCAYDAWTC